MSKLGWPAVMHVEDNLGDKELLEHASHAAQVRWHLQWVEDGQAAVDYLSSTGPFASSPLLNEPSLMLLDLKMPRKNGFEVLEWVRHHERFKRLPIVIFTASNSPKDTRRAFELGANSLIVKPTSYRELVAYAQAIYHYWFELNQRPEP